MRDPDLTGLAGRAWKVALPENHPTVAGWLVDAPMYHPAWQFYSICVLSLADHPDYPPAIITTPGAQYELLSLSLDPDGQPYDPDKPKNWRHLDPVNVAYQFAWDDERQVKGMLTLLVKQVLAGRLTPEGGDGYETVRRIWATQATHALTIVGGDGA